jgi:excisionase family DNA binding protein
MVRARTRSRRGIKIHRNYTVEEVARRLGVAKATVRRWINNGLPALKDRKPMLVLGADLAIFLSASKVPRQSCLPQECFCLRCRAPRLPAGYSVKFVPLTPTNGNMRANCSTCRTIMHKRIRRDVIESLRPTLNVSYVHAQEPIRGSVNPSVNVNLSNEGNELCSFITQETSGSSADT